MAPPVTGEEGAADAPPLAGERTITVRSADGEHFSMTAAGARLSPPLGNWVRELGFTPLRTSNVPARFLDLVIKYCNKHGAHAAANPSHRAAAAAGISSFNIPPPHGDLELDEWDRELVRSLGDDVDALYYLIRVADVLRLRGLIDAACERIAGIIKRCDTPKQIREIFRISESDDLTAEQKEWVRKKHSCAFGPDDI